MKERVKKLRNIKEELQQAKEQISHLQLRNFELEIILENQQSNTQTNKEPIELKSDNPKGLLLEYCAKNKLEPPKFEYKVKVTCSNGNSFETKEYHPTYNTAAQHSSQYLLNLLEKDKSLLTAPAAPSSTNTITTSSSLPHKMNFSDEVLNRLYSVGQKTQPKFNELLPKGDLINWCKLMNMECTVESNIIRINANGISTIEATVYINKKIFLRTKGEFKKKKEAEFNVSKKSLSILRNLCHNITTNFFPVAWYSQGQKFLFTESRVTEFKSFKHFSEKNYQQMKLFLRIYGNCFLNTKGGSLFFGITDDNEIRGITISPDMLDELQLWFQKEIKTWIPKISLDHFSFHIYPVLVRNK